MIQTMLRSAAIAVLAISIIRPASSLEFTVVSRGHGSTIVATGPFESGDAGRLAELLRRVRNVEVITFQSPGGVAVEGMEVGRVIRRAGLATHLPSGVSCASACTYAFLGGRVRTADSGARYGVHMFSVSGSQRMMSQIDVHIRQRGPAAAAEVVRMIEEESAQFAAQLAYYSIEMGVSLRLLEPNFRTSHTGIRWLTGQELRQFNVVNAN